jgi:hypothetical protein
MEWTSRSPKRWIFTLLIKGEYLFEFSARENFKSFLPFLLFSFGVEINIEAESNEFHESRTLTFDSHAVHRLKLKSKKMITSVSILTGINLLVRVVGNKHRECHDTERRDFPAKRRNKFVYAAYY